MAGASSGAGFGGRGAGAPTSAGAGAGDAPIIAGSSQGGQTGTGGTAGGGPTGGGGAAGGASGEGGADAGTGGGLACGDCSLSGEVCMVGVCDGELGRCIRLPIVACQGGDGCCPRGCAQEDDADCSSFRVVLAPAYSGNRREDGALGATTFTGLDGGQLFRAFFSFDLSGIEGRITSAALDLHYESYLSSDPDEHFVVSTVTTPIEALVDAALRPDVFDDLQNGAYCFDTSMTLAHTGSTTTFEFDETALSDPNANLGSYRSFGIIADFTAGGSGATEGIRFSDGVNAPRERLTLTVEP